MQFGPLQLKACKYGWMLFSGPYIGKCFDLYGEYSESEVSMMRAFLHGGNTVIDVGANIGDLTVPLAKIVGNGGRVYAVESNPETFNVLCANLALNGLYNVKPINAFVAAAESANTAGVWGKNAYTGQIWPPQFMSLDSLNLPACHLLKIDVDGKELDVLISAADLIKTHRPILYFENDRREASAPLLAHALALDYDLYWHRAPIFSSSNFFGQPKNHWAPKNIVSVMILGLPSERGLKAADLQQVKHANEWWS
jgi:hypothetical protein